MGSGSSRRGSPRGPSVAVEVEATQDDVGDSKKPSTNGVHHHRPTSKAKSRTQPRGNKILFPDDYPRPLPPSDSRDDICCQTILNSIDDYIFDAPEDLLTGSYTNLVKYLVNDGKWGDVGKVRAIFRWITTIDIYGLLDKEAPVDTPLEYFQRIRKGTGNHAHLFAGLCKFAGLKCVIVNGINKSAAYEVGEKINRRKMAAQWNAIYLNGAWRFVDVFWASTCIVGRKTGKWTLLQYDGRTVDRRISRDDGRQEHRSNDFFFLTEPEQLIYTHFPNDSQWQLLNRPLTFEEFEEAAYVREMFFLMGLSFTDQSHHKCIVHADTGEVKIELGLPPNSEKYTFKYTVYLEEDNNDVRSFNDDVQLENFVLYQQSETFLRYSSRFPVAGTFKVDIYGHDATTSQTLDLLTSYIIKCKSPFPNCQPLPDTPAIGWGVGKKARDIGIRAKSHENGIIESADGTFEIRLKLEKEINLNQLILHNTINSEDLQHHAVTRIENGEVIVNVRLPAGNSQYALKLYANEASNEGEMENVCNYLLRSMAHPPQQSYPKLASAILGERPFNDKLGVTALTHVNGLIETTDGKVVLDFAKEKGVELSCELTNNDLFEEALKKCVQVEQDEDTARFTLSLNEIGEYGFNIYGRQSDDRRQIFNLHNYLIQKHYDETSERRALKPLRPPVGFKANVDDLTIQGDKAIENWKIVTADRKHKLRIPATSKKTIGELRRVNAVGTHLKGGVKIKRDADEDVVTLDLPDDGEYVLNIFEKRGKNVLSTTKTYHVVRDSSLVTGDDGLDIVSSDAESMDSCSTEIRQIVEEPEPKPPGPKRDDAQLSDYADSFDETDCGREFRDVDEGPNILVISATPREYDDEEDFSEFFEDDDYDPGVLLRPDVFYDSDISGECIADIIVVGEEHEHIPTDDETSDDIVSHLNSNSQTDEATDALSVVDDFDETNALGENSVIGFCREEREVNLDVKNYSQKCDDNEVALLCDENEKEESSCQDCQDEVILDDTEEITHEHRVTVENERDHHVTEENEHVHHVTEENERVHHVTEENEDERHVEEDQVQDAHAEDTRSLHTLDDQEEIAAMQTIEEESPRLLVNKADDSATESVDGDSDKDVESPVVAKTEEELEMERIEEENRIAEEAETKKARQKKRLTERLQEAMKVRLDVDRLSRAISKFISAGIENDALLAEGKRMLELWTLILNLNTGIRTRNIKLVEPAIQKAARHDDSELRNYVALAHRMMEQVRKIERLRHSILKLNQKTIAEIRAYSRPPPAVEQVMTASFLLMGEEEYELKDWKWIQCLMGRIGPDSVKKRVADTNVDDVPIEIALRAQQIYEGFTLNDVRDVSAGAAAFYVWTSGMIEACINNFKAAGGNLFSVRPKTCRRPGTRGRPFTMAGNRPQTQAGRRPATQATRPFTQGDIPRSESQVHQERRLSHELPPKPKITQW